MGPLYIVLLRRVSEEGSKVRGRAAKSQGGREPKVREREPRVGGGREPKVREREPRVGGGGSLKLGGGSRRFRGEGAGRNMSWHNFPLLSPSGVL